MHTHVSAVCKQRSSLHSWRLRQACLQEGGRVVPAKGTLYAQVVQCPALALLHVRASGTQLVPLVLQPAARPTPACLLCRIPSDPGLRSREAAVQLHLTPGAVRRRSSAQSSSC